MIQFVILCISKGAPSGRCRLARLPLIDPFPSLRHVQARWQLSRAKPSLAYQQTSTPPREYRMFQAKYGGNRSPLRTML
jgi:hypothetical protein